MINRRLYDLIIRHQIYVEGFKNFQSAEFKKLLPEFIKELRREFKSVPVKFLDEMTKREVNTFKRNVERVNKKFGDFWNKQLLKALNDFMEVDLAFNKKILANYLIDDKLTIDNEDIVNKFIRDNAQKEDENKLFHFSWVYNNRNDKIREFFYKSIIPAVGLLPKQYLDKFILTINDKIQAEINSGWADNKPIDEILKDIEGTKENNFKDGILLGMATASDTTLKTLFQDATSLIAAGVFGMVYDKYVWVSVIDSATSEICFFRNMKIYTYGKGPLPPAHPRCRSKTIPFTGVGNVPKENFSEWTNLQPTKIKNYVAKGFPALSLDAYANKIDDVLTR